MKKLMLASAVLTFISTAAQADMTCNLLSDTSVRPLVNYPNPPYLQPVTDPTYGTTITRISGDPGTPMNNITGGIWGNKTRHQYSTRQAWNADMSLIWLADNNGGTPSSSIFLDGSTYQPLFAVNPPSSSDVVWSSTDPSTMLDAYGSTLAYWNVRTYTLSVINVFTGYSNLKFGPWKGNFSYDGNLVVLSGNNPSGVAVFFAYNISTKVKYADIIPPAVASSIYMSPRGDYIVETDTTDHGWVFDLNGNLVNNWPEYGRPSHFDLTIDQNGDEVAIGVDKTVSKGKVIKRRLGDAAVTQLTFGIYPSWAEHTSTREYQVTGHDWAVSSYEDNGSNWPLYNREELAIKADQSIVYRLGDNHSENPDYWAQPQGSPSPDGLRVIFASDWQNPNGNARPVGAYVIDLRKFCTLY